MKQFFSHLTCLVLFVQACSPSKHEATHTSDVQPIVDSIRSLYAPDKRTALFDVTVTGMTLAGETNLPAAKTALLQALPKQYIDSIRTLPEASPGAYTLAIVSISVANLRAKPGHPSEMVTQATLGVPLKVLKKDRGWYLVQTPDKYIAWTEGGGIKLMNMTEAAQWQSLEKAIYIKPYGFAYATANTDSSTVSDLVYGDVVAFRQQQGNFYEVSFPDGRTAYIPAGEITLYKDWAVI